MSLRDLMKKDALALVRDQQEFAQEVTYTPKGGSPRTINAIVSEEPLDSNAQDSNRGVYQKARVHVLNDATQGTDNPKRGDRITMRSNPGAAEVVWVVEAILSGDDAMFELLVGQ